MNILFIKNCNRLVYIILAFLSVACVPSGRQNKNTMDNTKSNFVKGTYGYDVAFFTNQQIQTIELKDNQSEASILLVPGYQGRVMTSSANGYGGKSFGWINYKLIESGKVSSQFNPYGGEERFWMGPEGGPFSIYFPQGEEQGYKSWRVPPVLDTESYDIKEQNSNSVTFVKNTELRNASGFLFKIGIERTVTLLSRDTLWSLFNVDFPSGIFDVVAYQSDNTITNIGSKAWTKDEGLLSIWMLGMFNPSPATTVFIPYKTEGQGPAVNDDYFGKVPSDRLIVDSGTVFFKIDGKYRSKIGLSPTRAKELCGSYDSEMNILTLIWGSLPSNAKEYVNSKWGEQDDPYNGDAINAYNDGPVEDGSIMGPFYEIETSSPAAALQPGSSMTHSQRVMHVQGSKLDLARIVNELFDLNLYTIESKFQ